jgi:hypothetical protein
MTKLEFLRQVERVESLAVASRPLQRRRRRNEPYF